MLYSRHCTGSRVVTCTDTKTVCGIKFPGYGSHHDAYPCPYLTIACAVGMKTSEVEEFAVVLRSTVTTFRKQLNAKQPQEESELEP
jgi:O-phospho-L-seryl-tRNASec:L-selenocysteinyl-tRNA synthase